ncbi:MAG: hypothetical protein AAF667_11980 [Pseudomonadota bacterium]
MGFARSLATLHIIFVATGANASEVLDGDAFRQATEGQTIVYSNSGGVYGIEQYLRQNRVLWQTAPGECQFGRWYSDAGAICFEYEDRTAPSCWTMTREANGLVARLVTEGESFVLREVGRQTEPLNCPGPKVGT